MMIGTSLRKQGSILGIQELIVLLPQPSECYIDMCVSRTTLCQNFHLNKSHAWF